MAEAAILYSDYSWGSQSLLLKNLRPLEKYFLKRLLFMENFKHFLFKVTNFII